MNIEQRIARLEKYREIEQHRVKVIIVNADDSAGQTKELTDKAIADYKASHPEWKEGDIIMLEWIDGRFISR